MSCATSFSCTWHWIWIYNFYWTIYSNAVSANMQYIFTETKKDWLAADCYCGLHSIFVRWVSHHEFGIRRYYLLVYNRILFVSASRSWKLSVYFYAKQCQTDKLLWQIMLYSNPWLKRIVCKTTKYRYIYSIRTW